MNEESSTLKAELALEFEKNTPKNILDKIRAEIMRELINDIRKNSKEKLREEIKESLRAKFYSKLASGGDEFFDAKSFKAFLAKELTIMNSLSSDKAQITVNMLTDIEKEHLLSKYLISEMLIRGGLT